MFAVTCKIPGDDALYYYPAAGRVLWPTDPARAARFDRATAELIAGAGNDGPGEPNRYDVVALPVGAPGVTRADN